MLPSGFSILAEVGPQRRSFPFTIRQGKPMHYAHFLLFRRGSSQRGSVQSSSGQDEHEEEGTVDLSALAFVERQEEWLRRKQTTLRAKTHEVERAVKNAATFNPNLAISQSSLRPAQVRHYPPCLALLCDEALTCQGRNLLQSRLGRVNPTTIEPTCTAANVCSNDKSVLELKLVLLSERKRGRGSGVRSRARIPRHSTLKEKVMELRNISTPN